MRAATVEAFDSALELDSQDEVLRPGDYWYYADNWTVGGIPFPVTLTFSDWQFPHNNIPEDWDVFPPVARGDSLQMSARSAGHM